MLVVSVYVLYSVTYVQIIQVLESFNISLEIALLVKGLHYLKQFTKNSNPNTFLCQLPSCP